MKKNIMNQINRYYESGIYENEVSKGDYVTITDGTDVLSVPAKNGFLAVQCAARDISYNGDIKIYFSVAFDDDKVTIYGFLNGKPVKRTKNHSMFIHGQEYVLSAD